MHFALIAFCGYRVFSTIVYTLLNSYTRAAQRRDDIERQRSLMQDRHNPQYGSTAIIHSGGAATRVDQPCGQPQSLQAAPSNQTVQPYQTTQSSEGTRPYSEVQPQHATQLEQSRRLPDAAGQRTGPLDATAHSRAPSVPSRIRQLQFAQRLHCSLNDIGESSRQEVCWALPARHISILIIPPRPSSTRASTENVLLTRLRTIFSPRMQTRNLQMSQASQTLRYAITLASCLTCSDSLLCIRVVYRYSVGQPTTP